MIKLITEYPIAINSPDHISTLGPEPTGGPSKDNSKNWSFNKKLYNLLTHKTSPLNILDLGCSGGGFVEDCVNDGHLAIGLEGSDYSLKHKRAAWATITNNLFTCDCTKPFELINQHGRILFDVITAWEFMEHIHKKDLLYLCDNIKNNLKKDGLFIASISMAYGPPFHQTTENKDWWLNFFESQNLYNNQELVDYFHPNWIRTDDNSFHVVLKT